MKAGSREHIEFSRLLVNTIQEYAIFLLDANGVIATWSPGAERLKGYSPDEIIGKHFSTFYPQKDKDARKPEIELEIAKRDGHVEDEGWRIRKDGSKFWANVVITALRDDNGDLVGFAKVTRDLSERRKHEQELRKANLVLKRQRQELMKLNKAKDEFISLASHQLRTPSSGVKQYIGLLLEGFAGDVTPKQQRLLLRANESNDRQISLINDLLRVAQVDAGKIVLNPATTNVNELLIEIINEQREKFSRQQQLVTMDVPPDDVYAKVDKLRLRMALENITDNASKYTHKGGEIIVRLTTENRQAVIEIVDNGVGIEQTSIQMLFNKFSRIPNELSEQVGGSGLGLYWAQKIVQLHNGTIEVRSEITKGTTFIVTIPGVSNA